MILKEPKEKSSYFVCVGHYLSATSLMWASTQNDELKQKMASLVAGLSACQEKIGTGYLSAFPSEFFDRFEAIQQVWAPYYTIHKVLSKLHFDNGSAFDPLLLDFNFSALTDYGWSLGSIYICWKLSSSKNGDSDG